MKVLVFSDVHGNIRALDAMLRQEKPLHDKLLVFCGDIVGYYPHEKEVAECLDDIPELIGVRGNHDQYYQECNSQRRIDELCSKYGPYYRRKEPIVQKVVSKLPIHTSFEIDKRKFFVCHGSPRDCLEGRLYPDSELPTVNDYQFVLCGHTHYRMLGKSGNTLYVNPGSLGQPRDKKGFSYCVLEEDTRSVTFKTVCFDINKLKAECIDVMGTDSYAYKVLERENVGE